MSFVSELFGIDAKQAVTVPGPSEGEASLHAEQAALLREQRKQLDKQIAQQDLLQPLLLQQLGITPKTDEAGNITGTVGEDQVKAWAGLTGRSTEKPKPYVPQAAPQLKARRKASAPEPEADQGSIF